LNTYEAMMLFDPAFASEQDNIRKEVDRLLERAGAQLIAMHRWDERKLAYEIKKRKRGVYVLIYMRAPAESIAPLERDIGLSEGVLRALILRADHVTEEKMQIAPPINSLQYVAQKSLDVVHFEVGIVIACSDEEILGQRHLPLPQNRIGLCE